MKVLPEKFSHDRMSLNNMLFVRNPISPDPLIVHAFIHDIGGDSNNGIIFLDIYPDQVIFHFDYEGTEETEEWSFSIESIDEINHALEQFMDQIIFGYERITDQWKTLEEKYLNNICLLEAASKDPIMSFSAMKHRWRKWKNKFRNKS